MINRFMKWFIVVVSLGFVLGCGGWIQKSKTFIKSPFGKKEETSKEIREDAKDNHMEKGKKLFMKGKMKSALEEFNAVVRKDPDSPEIHYNLGLTYYELGGYSKAINEYKRSIQLKPDLAEAHFNLGVAYNQSGQEKNALQSYNSAMKYGIDDAAIHFNMGLSYLKLSRFREAKKELYRALELEPNLAEAYNNLGYIDEAAGDLELAVTEYKKALAIKPDYKLARENLERLSKVPFVKERLPITKKKFLSHFFFELDGKYVFTRDLEIEMENSSKKLEIGSDYQNALFRIGYRPFKRIDLFLDFGFTNLSFDEKVSTAYEKYGNFNFESVIGPAYGAGLNADIFHWNRMNLGFDAGLGFLMGSNEEEDKPGKKATADWTEYTVFIKTRYLGLNKLVPYGGFIFSRLDGTLKVDNPLVEIPDMDYNESDPFVIFLGSNYFYGEHIRLQAEARFLGETSLTFRAGYFF